MHTIAYSNSERVYVVGTWYRITRARVVSKTATFVTLEVAIHCESTGQYKVLKELLYRVMLHYDNKEFSYNDLCDMYNHSIRAIIVYAFR